MKRLHSQCSGKEPSATQDLLPSEYFLATPQVRPKGKNIYINIYEKFNIEILYNVETKTTNTNTREPLQIEVFSSKMPQSSGRTSKSSRVK